MDRDQNINEDVLREIAIYQKGVLITVALYIVAIVVNSGLKFHFSFPVAILLLISLLGIGAVFTFLLSTRVYGFRDGLILGIFTLIPIVGLVILLVVNSKATKLLKEHGLKVGLLGVRLSDFNQHFSDD
ncbi:MAG: hypothetical protein Tsb009_27210 [Planctomycetaceae bacterium]